MKTLVMLILLAAAFVGGYYAGRMPNSPEPLKGLTMVCDKIIGATGDVVASGGTSRCGSESGAPAQASAVPTRAPAERPLAASRANVPEVQSVQWAAAPTCATTWDQELTRNR